MRFKPPNCKRLQGAADARRRTRRRTFVLQVPDNKADAVPCDRLRRESTVTRDHRPYFIKKSYLNFQEFYTRRYVRPRLVSLGRGPHFIKPWHVEIFGTPVKIGNYATVIAAPDSKIRLAVWPQASSMI